MKREIGTEKRRQMTLFGFERMAFTLRALGLRFDIVIYQFVHWD